MRRLNVRVNGVTMAALLNCTHDPAAASEALIIAGERSGGAAIGANAF